MKTIKLFSLLAASLLLASSCEKEDDRVSINADVAGPQILSPSGDEVLMISQETFGDSILFSWSDADYGVNTPVDYVVEFAAAGSDFENPVVLGETMGNSLSVNVGNLNGIALGLPGAAPNEPVDYEVRVRASLFLNQEPVYSPVRTMTITTFELIIPELLWVPGDYQAWTPASAPTIFSTAPNVYEGYIYFQQASGFKFTSAPNWDNINYGFESEGVLTTDGLAGNLNVAVPGYYHLMANTAELTYAITLIETWGLIGTATPGGWDTSTPMTFDESTGLWSQTLDLVAGELKFRANNGWEINYGPANGAELEGQLIQTEASIAIPENGNYTVVMDLSKSNESFQYLYSVTLN